MAWGLIQSRLKAKNKKINNPSEIAIRQVNALTVRFVFPSSRTKKIRPEANEIRTIIMARKTTYLVNICYTPGK